MKTVLNTCFPDADQHMSAQYAAGHDQLDALRLALGHVPASRRLTAVDVGAYVGVFTRELARAFTHVYAFEPDPDNYACLRHNTAGLPGVSLVPAALGHETTRAGMDTDDRWPGNTGGRYLTPGDVVDVRRLDDLLSTAVVDFMKIDAEGSELSVLRGAEEVLRRSRPVLLVEIKNRLLVRQGDHPGDTMRWLEQLGARQCDRLRNDYVFSF